VRAPVRRFPNPPPLERLARHLADRHVLLLLDNFEQIIAARFAIPPGHPRFAWAGPQETIVQVHGIGSTDITFVNPADDPRKKK
jgi:hypothetical protein